MYTSPSVALPCWRPAIHRKAKGPSLVPSSENPVISVFSFQVSASRLTTFNALWLTGVWWELAHSGCSQHQSLTKQAIEQAVTFFSEHPFTFHRFTPLNNSQSHLRYIGLFREIKAVVCSQCMISWRTRIHRGWPGQLGNHPWSSILSSFPSKMVESSLYFYSITVPVWFFKHTPAWNNGELALRSPVTMFRTPPTQDFRTCFPLMGWWSSSTALL